MVDTYARQLQLVGNSADWAANDLVLHAGELGLELDGGVYRGKVGDGVTAFSNLPYAINRKLEVANIAQLRAATVRDGRLFVEGYYAPGDGGGGEFRWDSSSLLDDDAGMVIIPDGQSALTAGRWIRLFEGDASLLYWGARRQWQNGAGPSDSPAISAAVDWAMPRNAAIYAPAGEDDFAFDAEKIITAPITIYGDGPFATWFRPLDGYSGWFLQLNDCWREASDPHGIGAGTLWPKRGTTKSGVTFRDFGVVGKRFSSPGVPITQEQNGIRTWDRNDDMNCQNLWFGFLNGGGLSLGRYGTLPLVRESTFKSVHIYACGNTVTGQSGFELTGSAGSSDGLNQIHFSDFHYTYNYVAGYIGTSSTQPLRRIRFENPMIHGRNNISDAPSDDVMLVEGRVQDLKIQGGRFNGSHNVGGTKYATWRFRELGGQLPTDIEINGDTRVCQGHGYVIEGGVRLIITGTVQSTSIQGDEIMVTENSLPGFDGLEYHVKGQKGTRSINVDPSVRNYVSSFYSGEPVMPLRLASGAEKLGDADAASGLNTPSRYFGTDPDPNDVPIGPNPTGGEYAERRSTYHHILDDYDEVSGGYWIKMSGGAPDAGGWERVMFSDSGSNVGQFSDVNSPLNKGAYDGMQRWDNVNKRMLHKAGALPEDPWKLGDTVVITPT